MIVGDGAAGQAAETLRHEGYGGRITMLSAVRQVPMTDPIYRRVISPVLRPKVRTYDALLLATGADPVRLDAGDAPLPVHQLQTLAAAHALAAEAVKSRRAVVMGAGFIGQSPPPSALGVSRCMWSHPEQSPCNGFSGTTLADLRAHQLALGKLHTKHLYSAKTRRLWRVPGV